MPAVRAFLDTNVLVYAFNFVDHREPGADDAFPLKFASLRSRNMFDLDIAPPVSQILGNQPPVAMIGLLLAAE